MDGPDEHAEAQAASPTFVAGPVRVRVPASSANLGPGFDALALALGLHDVLTAEVTDPGSGDVTITVEGEGSDSVPRDASHLVVQAMRRGFAALGVDGAPAPGIRLRCANTIPHSRGLGSSAAAIVGGLALARELVEGGRDRFDDVALFAAAADLEGHPDNVAAAVFGGLTVAYADAGGWQAVRLDVTAAVALVAFVPPDPLSTAVARGLLPTSVPHADAARNAGRAALLVAALTGRSDRLLAATEDHLHERFRAPAMPASAALVASLREDGFPAVVSGAGPTVLALVPPDQAEAAAGHAPHGWRVLHLPVDDDGVRRLG